MHKYELALVISAKPDDETRAAILDKAKGYITRYDGTIGEIEEWGKKKLAYEINGLTDGDYTLIDFQTEPEAIAELDRVLHIMDAVVRYMIVRRDDRLDSVENA